MENEHEQTFSPGEQNPEEIMYKELSGCWETAIWTDNQLQVEDNSNSAAKLESIWEPVASMRRVAACLDKSAAKGSSSLIEDTNAALSVQSSADASEYEVEPGLARPGEMEMAHSLGVAGTTGSEIEFIAPDSQDCRPPSACSKYSEGSPYHLGSDDGYIVESQSIQQQRSLMEQQHHIHQREENHKKHQVQQQDHMQQQYEQNQYKQEQQNREEEEGQDQERLQQLQSKRLQLGQCGSSSAAPRHVMQPSENVRNLWGLDKPHAEAPYEETTPKEAAKASGSKTSDAQLHTETLQLSPPPDSAIRFPSTGLNEVTTTWGALQLPGGALGEEGEFLTPMEAAQRAAEFAFAAEMAANRAAQLEEGEQPAPRTEAPKSQRLSPAVRLLPETFSGASRSVQPFGSCHQALKSSGGVTYGVSTAPTAPTLCPVALALPSDISDPEEGEVDRDSALAAARYFSTCAIQAAGVAVAGCMQSLQGGPALLRQTMLDERIRHWLPQSCLQGVTIPQDLEGLKSTHASRLGGVGGVSVLKVANLCEKCMQETKEATTQLIDPPIQESVPLSRQGAISGRESEQKAQMSGTQVDQKQQYQNQQGTMDIKRDSDELAAQGIDIYGQQRMLQQLQREVMEQKLQAHQEIQAALRQQKEGQELLAVMKKRAESLDQQREQLDMQRELQSRLQHELHMRELHQQQQHHQQLTQNHQQQQQLHQEEILMQMRQQLLEQQLLQHQQVVANFEKQSSEQKRHLELLQQQTQQQIEQLRAHDQQQQQQKKEMWQREQQLQQQVEHLRQRELKLQQLKEEQQAKALFLRQQEESQQKVAEEYRQQKCRLEEMEKEMSEKQAQVKVGATCGEISADTDGSQPVFGFLVSLEVKDDVTMQEVRELEQQLVILCLAHLNERKRHLVILRKPLETEGELLRRAAAGQESAVPSRALNGEAATVTSAAPSAASLVANAISQEGQRRIIGVKLKAWNAAARCVRLALAVLTKRAAFLAAHGSTRMLQAVTVGSGLPGGSTLSSQPLRDATAAEASQSVLNGGRDLTSLGVGVSTQTLQCTFAQGLSPRPGVLATATEEASHGAWDGIGTEITPEGHVGAALLTQQHQQPSRHPIDWKPLVGTFLPEEGVSASTAPEGLPERLRSSPSEIFRRLPSGVHWGDLSVLGISRRTHTMTTTEGILGGLRSENSTSYTVNPRATVSPHTTTGAPLDATTPNVAGLPTSKATPASSSMWRPPLSLSPLSWRGGGVIPRDLGHTGLQPPQRRQLAPLPTSSGISYRR
ncbi:uncharacterized protein LOC34621712 [Cyclospora cayetanensis]|uniref:Uncharacterized protein LOC34621712 n=1 Tax=Cyclospora cayetanensis TaxID=88456 RepID=A0A6P6S2J1_9EIME|nr:uncharacterized protein LOC34621712 [Cyclospora cayetanensis]